MRVISQFLKSWKYSVFKVSTCTSASGQLLSVCFSTVQVLKSLQERLTSLTAAYLRVKFLKAGGCHLYCAFLYVREVLKVKRRASWVIIVAVCILSSQRAEIFSSLLMSIFELFLCSNILSRIQENMCVAVPITY